MRTRGTHSRDLSDSDLRSYIAAAALDVYEAVLQNLGDYEIAFATGTLNRFVHELDLRRIANDPTAACADCEAPASGDRRGPNHVVGCRVASGDAARLHA